MSGYESPRANFFAAAILMIRRSSQDRFICFSFCLITTKPIPGSPLSAACGYAWRLDLYGYAHLTRLCCDSSIKRSRCCNLVCPTINSLSYRNSSTHLYRASVDYFCALASTYRLGFVGTSHIAYSDSEVFRLIVKEPCYNCG